MRYAHLTARLALVSVVFLLPAACSKKPAPADATDAAGLEAPPPAPVQPVRPDSDVAPVTDAGTVRDAAVKDADASRGAATLTDTFFEFNDWAVRPDQRAVLDANAQALRANPRLRITVEGHCDERGTNAFNMALGQKRADAVKDYLVALGIDSERIQTISYGKERPFALGHDEESWQQNRRAHFVVQSR